MHFQSLLVSTLPLLSLASAHKGHKHRSPRNEKRAIPSTPAFNPTQHNLVPQAPGGPELFYNGSGNVPGIDTLSPIPPPLPALTYVITD